MIGVLGATGQVGGPLMEVLVEEGVPVRALAHSSESAAKLESDNVDVRVGDLRDKGDLHRFLEGVSSLFLLTPPSPDQTAVQNAIVDAAVEKGVESIVKLSVYTAAEDSLCNFSRWHIVNDRHIAESGLAYTILHPHSFMQSMALQYAEGMRAIGVVDAAVRPDAPVTIVDVRDVGAVAARVLLAGEHRGETLLITGPEEITFSECTAQMAKALGMDLTYQQISLDEAREKFTALGAPEFLVDGLVGLHQMYDSGELNPLTDVVERYTGKPARSYAQFLDDQLHLFR